MIDGLGEGEQDEDEEEMDIRAPDSTSNEQMTAFVPTDPEVPLEPDAEDLATSELISADSNAKKYEAYIVIDGHEGGNMSKHKSSILRVFSDNNPNSTDQLRHVMDTSRFDAAGRGLAVNQDFDHNNPCASVQDPAATLVRSKDLVWLALTQIADLRHNNIAVQTLPTRLLSEPNVRVKVQIISIAPVVEGSENEDGDWEWTGHFEKLSGQNSTCEIDGRWIELLNPAAVPPTRLGNKAKTTYRFNSAETVAVTSLLYQKLQNDTDRLPNIGWTTSFPYRTWKGKSNTVLPKILLTHKYPRRSLFYL